MGVYDCDCIDNLLPEIRERQERREKLYNTQESCNDSKGETMPTYKQFIDLEELQNFILKYMQSDDLEDIFTSTCFYTESNSSRLFDAMQYGVLLIGLVIGTSKVPKYAFIKD